MIKQPAAFWYNRHNNFGDLLTVHLVKALYGCRPRLVRNKGGRYVAAGSLTHFLHAGDLVWGTGALSPVGPVARARFFAVRGPLTGEYLRRQGHDVPEVYGDPGLLIPRLYRCHGPVRRWALIIPHYYDAGLVNLIPGEDVGIVDILSGVRNVLGMIASSQVILSSCLHGLVLAEALGKPAIRVKLRDWRVSGDFKFRDYYEGTGRSRFSTADWVGRKIDRGLVRDAADRAAENTAGFAFDPHRLLSACPFRRIAVAEKLELTG